MRAITLLVGRELKSYFDTAWGWTILAFVLVLDGIMFNAFALGTRERYSADVLSDFFYFSSGTTMIAGILLTMRLVAEERQTGTFTLLQTAPIRSLDIVLGKFLGAFLFLTLITLATAYMPALIFVHGKVSIGQILVGYTGLLSLSAATIAIGTFSSSIARNQLLAAVIGAGILVFILLGWMLGQITEAPLSGVFSYTAIFDRHFQPFMKGRLNTEGLVYFGSVCFGFLLLATRSLQLRRLR
jgi:ABC-2 type transport system permease protein